MERIGERLRRRREELGLTLENVSEMIRYRPEIISAIEEGRTTVFPAKAYLSAFLRAYAAVLELDPREIVREQKSEEERAFEAIRNIRVKPRRKRGLNRRVLYVIVPIVLAAVALLVVDRFLWDREAGPSMAPDYRPEVPSGEDSSPGAAEREGGAGPAPGGTPSDSARAAETEAPGEGDRPDGSPSGNPAGAPGGQRPGSPGEDGGGEAWTGDAGGAARDGESAARGDHDRAAVRDDAAAGRGDGVAGGDDAGTARRDDGVAGGDDDRAAVRDDASAGGEAGAREPGSGRSPVVAAEADGAAGGTAVTGERTGEPAGTPEALPGGRAEAAREPRTHKLVVSARRGAYINLRSGERKVYDGYFGGGKVDSFYSDTPFVIVAITDRGAWTFVQDGERVRLPGSSSEDVSNFVIPTAPGDRP